MSVIIERIDRKRKLTHLRIWSLWYEAHCGLFIIYFTLTDAYSCAEHYSRYQCWPNRQKTNESMVANWTCIEVIFMNANQICECVDARKAISFCTIQRCVNCICAFSFNALARMGIVQQKANSRASKKIWHKKIITI